MRKGIYASIANGIIIKPAPMIFLLALTNRLNGIAFGEVAATTGRVSDQLVMRPANDAAAIQIHDHRQVAPFVADTQIGDIPHPDLIGLGDFEVADAIWDFVEKGMGTWVDVIQDGGSGHDLMRLHKPGYTILAHINTLLLQGLCDARAAGLDWRAWVNEVISHHYLRAQLSLLLDSFQPALPASPHSSTDSD